MAVCQTWKLRAGEDSETENWAVSTVSLRLHSSEIVFSCFWMLRTVPEKTLFVFVVKMCYKICFLLENIGCLLTQRVGRIVPHSKLSVYCLLSDKPVDLVRILLLRGSLKTYCFNWLAAGHFSESCFSLAGLGNYSSRC